VQEVLVNICAARADAVALLSVPQHFARRELLDWRQRLTGITAFRDGRPLSYAAAYHGWPQIRELATPEIHPLRSVPPDGAVCGLIARREIQRGAWVAPANISLRGVVGLTPEFADAAELDLFEQQINLLQQQPGRFTPLSAHTLSSNPLLWQVSVRRLLILLRKMVLRQGQQYVFEPNDTRFQRRVQLGFERRLGALRDSGALVAFRVQTGDAVNTRNDYDNGRLIIEIQVAPSHPVEFISVVLLRSGERLLDAQER
jgi:phage tail sheath protein FI